MVRDDLEAKLIACYHSRDWAGALCLLEPLLHASTGPLLGWVKYQLAIVRYTLSVEFVPICLSLTDDALALLAPNSADAVQAALNGMVYAEYALEHELRSDYAGRLQAALDSQSPDVFPWTGRAHYALSHYYWQQGKEKRALRHSREAVRFHQAHTGPYNEHDRCCWLRRSHAALGHALLKLNDHGAARLEYEAALEAAPPDVSDQDVLYLQARLATAKGREVEARQLYRQALDAARGNREWVLAVEIVEGWASVIRSGEDQIELKRVMGALEVEAAHAENPALVLRLQRMSTKPLFGEGGIAI